MVAPFNFLGFAVPTLRFRAGLEGKRVDKGTTSSGDRAVLEGLREVDERDFVPVKAVFFVTGRCGCIIDLKITKSGYFKPFSPKDTTLTILN